MSLDSSSYVVESDCTVAWNVTLLVVFFVVFRTLHNYMMWHLVKSLSALLSKPFRDARKEFLKVLTGVFQLLCFCILLDYPVSINLLVNFYYKKYVTALFKSKG